jgi:hypothetical protein
MPPAGVKIRKLVVIRMETNAESAMEPTPVTAIAVRGMRDPKIARIRKLTIGNRGMSQRRLSISFLHLAHCISVERSLLMIELKNERQPHRNLRGCHRQNEEKHDLAIGLCPSGTRDDKCETSSIQHHLDGN